MSEAPPCFPEVDETLTKKFSGFCGMYMLTRKGPTYIYIHVKIHTYMYTYY